MKSKVFVLCFTILLIFGHVVFGQEKGFGIQAVSKLPSKDKRWALIIGVDNYGLKGAVNDAKALKNVLVKFAGFPENQIILLTSDSPNNSADRKNIIIELGKLTRSLKPDDFFLFAFSGHGKTIGESAYLIPSDGFFPDDDELLRDVSIDVDRVRKVIEKTNIKQVLMFIDACRDKVVETGQKGSRSEPLTETINRSFSFYEANKSVEAFVTLYAASLGEFAYEYEDKEINQWRGYFSRAVEEALSGKAANKKGEVTLAELVKYVQKNVPARSYRNEGKRQVPLRSTNNGFNDDELVLAKVDKIADSGNPVQLPPIQPIFPAFDQNNPVFLSIQTYQKGMEKFNKLEIDGAIEEFTKAIKINPKNADAFYMRGTIYSDFKENFDQAIADFNSVVEIVPQAAGALNSRGTAYYRKKNYDAAISDYSAAIKINAQYADPYINRSNALTFKGEADAAIADLNEVIRMQPQYFMAYVNRGMLFFMAKRDFESAVRDYTKAIAIFPRNPAPYKLRSDAYSALGKPDLAQADLQRYRELGGN